MKIFFAFLLVLLVGCSSDLDIMQDYPSVPVVYAVINPYDSVHYVRVGKTFKIHKKEDFLTLNNDSLQYDNVEVFLYGKVGDSITWVQQFNETRMDKEDGFFKVDDFQVFQLDNHLPIKWSGQDRYYYGKPDIDSLILEVRIHDMNLITRAAARVLWATKIIAYKSKNLFFVYGSKPSVFALPSTGETQGREFSVVYRQVELSVHFKEYYENDSAVKKISWMRNTGWDDNAYFIYPERFFDPMMSLLPSNDTILARRLDSIDITLITPSRFFNNYWFIRENWDEQDRPPYSNFDNSYGMFITIAKGELTGMTLNWQSLDSLCNGYDYKKMKFMKW